MVEKEAYLLELARYIVLNPVRAGMVRAAKDWPWSSYRGTAGISQPNGCLTIDWILSGFAAKKNSACISYRAFVKEGKHQPSPWEKLRNQVYLGSNQFIEDMLGRLSPDQSLEDIPKPQKRSPPKSLSCYEGKRI